MRMHLRGAYGFSLLEVDLIPFAVLFCAMFQYQVNFLQLQYCKVWGLASLLHFFPESLQSFKFHCNLSKQSLYMPSATVTTRCCHLHNHNSLSPGHLANKCMI